MSSASSSFPPSPDSALEPSGHEPLGAPAPPEVPDPSSPRALVQVPAWAPFLALLAAFAVALFSFGLITAAVRAAGGEVGEGGTRPGLLIPGTLVQDAAMVLGAFLFARMWISGVRPSTFGLRPTPLLPAVAWTLGLYAAFWVLAAIYSATVGTGPEQQLVDDVRNEDSLVALIGLVVLVAWAAPLVEELFFRGFLYGTLREKLPVWFAVLVSGAVFGTVHAGGSSVRTLGILTILGIAFCVLYQRTGSILPGIALHAVHNSLSFAATKELVWWAFGLVIVGSVMSVLATAAAVIAWERRRW